MDKSLEQHIEEALASLGDQNKANAAYFTFLKSELLMPIEKGSEDDPRVLFLEEGDAVFLPIFSQENYLKDWAAESWDQISIYHIRSMDLLEGLADNVTLIFNAGASSYKEFNPEEILKLQTMLNKIRQIVGDKE